jgi:hypothetical protein
MAVDLRHIGPVQVFGQIHLCAWIFLRLEEKSNRTQRAHLTEFENESILQSQLELRVGD